MQVACPGPLQNTDFNQESLKVFTRINYNYIASYSYIDYIAILLELILIKIFLIENQCSANAMVNLAQSKQPTRRNRETHFTCMH